MATELEGLVDAALTADGDFDDAWHQVSAAIAVAPDQAALRRLRIRLAEAACLRVAHIRDLRVLCELEPKDRQLAMESALLEHRWAWQLAQDDIALQQAGDEDDYSAIGEAQEWIQADAIRRLTALVSRHCQDADYMVLLLGQWDERIGALPPWVRLRCTLEALAANPHDKRLQRDLALQWVSISGFAPSIVLPEGTQPMGFAIDVYGNLHDALATERALQHIDAVLTQDQDDAELWYAKGNMHLGVSQFEDAAYACSRAADLWSSRSDEDAALTARTAEARELAHRCAAGRATLAGAWMEDLQKATATLGENLSARPDASEALLAFLAEAQSASRTAKEELDNVLNTEGQEMLIAAQAPDTAALEAMDALATRLAASVSGAIALTAARWRILQTDPQDMDPRLLAPASDFVALGLHAIGCLEHVDYTQQLGTPAVFRVWQHHVGDCIVSHAVAGAIDVVDLETEFSDGHQLVTSASRGKNFMAAGPCVDGWHVDTDVSFADLLALHKARVALRLAQHPELRTVSIHSLNDFIALQERQRDLKTRWRLQAGLTQFEALGVPVDKPEFFAAKLCQAVWENMQHAVQAVQVG